MFFFLSGFMVFLREQYPGLISQGNFVQDSLGNANILYEL